MRMDGRVVRNVAIVALAVGCSRPVPVTEPPAPQSVQQVKQGAALEVENNAPIEVRIYVIRAGIRTRLGAVNGMATERFELSPNLIERELQLIAEPVGGWDRRSTDPLGGRRRVDTSDPTPAWRTAFTDYLVVRPGQFVSWQLDNKLRSNHISIW